MASAAQIKKIHAIVRSVGMPRDEYESNLRYYGVEHSNDPLFTIQKASDFISKLNRIAQPAAHKNDGEGPTHSSPSVPTYRGKGKRGFNKHITPARADRIGILEKLLGWDNKRTLGFIFKQTGYQKAVEMLTSQEGGKVITGMTRILAQGSREKYLLLNNKSNRELQILIHVAEG